MEAIPGHSERAGTSPGWLTRCPPRGSVALSALFSEWWEKAIVNCIGLQGIFLIPSVNYVNILRKEGLKQNTVLHAVKEVLFLHAGFDAFVHCMEGLKKKGNNDPSKLSGSQENVCT